MKQDIKDQILAALAHPEGEEGLYFSNLSELHEEEERPPVLGDEFDILEALTELMQEGKVLTEEGDAGTIFLLQKS